MNINERKIALSVLECLRGDLIYAHLKNGSRILDVADLRQYIYEQMADLRTHAIVMDGLYGNNACVPHSADGNGHGGKPSVGHNTPSR